ncbi:MAG TPA: hypothetical protein VNZ45_11445 [Bacteroidia bacterium]|jgi:hypothetical protein|nr:hypothetical protein [Bacteroidia bacterium]
MPDIVPGDFSYLQKYAEFISKKDFWEEVLSQLNKDLAQNNAIVVSQPHLQGENAAEALVTELQKYLPNVTPRLSEILYRIDLGEKYEASLKDLPVDLYYRVLSELVLKRIIQKVITRRVYSDKKIN